MRCSVGMCRVHLPVTCALAAVLPRRWASGACRRLALLALAVACWAAHNMFRTAKGFGLLEHSSTFFGHSSVRMLPFLLPEACMRAGNSLHGLFKPTMVLSVRAQLTHMIIS